MNILRRNAITTATLLIASLLSTNGAFAQTVDEAYKLMIKDQLKESARMFNKIVEKDPANGDAHFKYGLCLARQEKYDEAIVYLDNAKRLMPTKYFVNVMLGQVYANKKNWPKAAEEFKEASEKNPKSFKAAYNLGIALNNLDKYDEAIAAYKKAAEIKPKSYKPLLSTAFLYRRMDKESEAKEKFEEGLKLVKDPKQVKVLRSAYEKLPKDARLIYFKN